MTRELTEGERITQWIVKGLLGMVALVAIWAGISPWYWVYHQKMEGEAMLAKSQFSKQVLVQDAMARQEAATSLAQAEVIRAEGVSKANKIIGQSLENNKEYLHYLWIHNLEAGDHDVIYVPTEAGLPIFEAGGRFQPRLPSRPKSGEPGTAEHPGVPEPPDEE